MDCSWSNDRGWGCGGGLTSERLACFIGSVMERLRLAVGQPALGGSPLPHGLQPRVAHQQHCICAHGLIELPHLQSPQKSWCDSTANSIADSSTSSVANGLERL